MASGAADILLAGAERGGEAPAVADDEVRWSYAALADVATRWAGGIRGAGIGPGDRVGLLAPPSARTVAAIHAVRLAGGVLVPLDPRHPAAALREQLARSRVELVLHDGSTPGAIDGVGGAARTLELASLDGPPLVAPRAASEAAVIVPTSGTTGTPKGAILTAANLLSSAGAWNGFLGATAGDAWLATLPLHHVAGLGIVHRAALAGAPIHVLPAFDAAVVRRALVKERVAFVPLVPTQLAAILDGRPPEAPSLRAILLGGAPIPPGLVRRAVDAGLPVVPTYGLTEATSGVTALPASESPSAPGSSGRPLPGVDLRIDAPSGEEGEILVRGSMVFAGYDGDEAATAGVLDADGWLRTGDIGRLDADGRLAVLDRREDLLVSGGENVYPAQVEAVLAASPLVAEVAVAGRRHERWGRVPVAVVVPAGHDGGVPPDRLVADLDRYARERLPRHAVPAGYGFVDALPRTAGGKVRRQEVTRIIETRPTIERVRRPDGAVLAVRRRGSGPPLLLCHATLSTAAELDGLAERLAERFTVLAVDRRSAGASALPPGTDPAPIDVAVHVADLLAVLDAAGLPGPALLVGHSYGGCVALEAVARHPDRFAGAWVFEPPYVPVAPDPVRRLFRPLGERIARIAMDEGAGAAGIAFLAAVAGADAVARLRPASRAAIEAEGRSAVADAALVGLDREGLVGISAPVEVATGGRSNPFYARIAHGLIARIPGASALTLDALTHGGPAARPEIVAPAVLAFADRIGAGE
ncbi:MAG TPA: alpha/beta fold hydrolase [Candidatus Limnocylindrales bacterium]|nr:alpha/beta fold hydrolase [Candidatus Limnocylindrales bacterium]